MRLKVIWCVAIAMMFLVPGVGAAPQAAAPMRTGFGQSIHRAWSSECQLDFCQGSIVASVPVSVVPQARYLVTVTATLHAKVSRGDAGRVGAGIGEQPTFGATLLDPGEYRIRPWRRTATTMQWVDKRVAPASGELYVLIGADARDGNGDDLALFRGRKGSVRVEVDRLDR